MLDKQPSSDPKDFMNYVADNFDLGTYLYLEGGDLNTSTADKIDKLSKPDI